MKIQGESTNSAVLRQNWSGFFLYALPWCALFLVPNIKKKKIKLKMGPSSFPFCFMKIRTGTIVCINKFEQG